MSTIISPSYKWIVYIGYKIQHSLNPTICVITEKGQLLPLIDNVWENCNFKNVISHDLYMLSF